MYDRARKISIISVSTTKIIDAAMAGRRGNGI